MADAGVVVELAETQTVVPINCFTSASEEGRCCLRKTSSSRSTVPVTAGATGPGALFSWWMIAMRITNARSSARVMPIAVLLLGVIPVPLGFRFNNQHSAFCIQQPATNN
jgi:hypothetical protein